MSADILISEIDSITEECFSIIEKSMKEFGWKPDTINKVLYVGYRIDEDDIEKVELEGVGKLNEKEDIFLRIKNTNEFSMSWFYNIESPTGGEDGIAIHLKKNKKRGIYFDCYIAGQCWYKPRTVERYLKPFVEAFDFLKPGRVTISDRYCEDDPYFIKVNGKIVVNKAPWWKT